MKKPTKTTAFSQPTSSESTARHLFANALTAIDVEISGLIDGSIDPPKKYTRVDRIAFLAKQACSFAAEERQAAKLERKSTDQMTKPTVLAWAKRLELAERAQLVREMADIDQRRSSLG